MTDPVPATPDSPAQEPTRPSGRRLTRSSEDKMIAGVCAGIARYAGVDPVLVRVLFVAGALLGAGSLAVIYLIAWVLMPEA